ncbi:MAG: hypothetical protein K0S57_2565 [Ramlibacter sp.]|nr:hypothetical protein [Ramlibacter sp.]
MSKIRFFGMAAIVISTATLGGCATLVAYAPQKNDSDPSQSVKYVQGVGTVTAKTDKYEMFMYPAFRTQGFKEPTFVLGYANNSSTREDFNISNVRAFFRGQPVPIYTYTEKIAEIQAVKRGNQIALAILGGLAAGAAAHSASHRTYASNYSGTAWNNRGGRASFVGSGTVRVYDPAAGILAGGAVAGATGVGIAQIENNAANAEMAAAGILQENTVEPMQMVNGAVILRDCCDQFPKPGDAIRFEVTASGRTSVFEFSRAVVSK